MADDLRKMAEAILEQQHQKWYKNGTITADAKTYQIDAMLVFAAEREAVARQQAIAECAKVCREKIEREGVGIKFHALKDGEECAEAIERLGESGDTVVVPREPTEAMLLAGLIPQFNAKPDTPINSFAVSEIATLRTIYIAMLSACERK